MHETTSEAPAGVRILILGVGGGGGRAVDHMIRAGLSGVEFAVMDTDAEALDGALSPVRVQLGKQLTGGRGAGADPEVGREAASDDRHRIVELVDGADLVMVVAGMGGGTGTGAAPIVAEVARELGILTLGVVTRPFPFEGKRRRRSAEEGVEGMVSRADAEIVLPNQRLLAMATDKTTLQEAFALADDTLSVAVRAIADLLDPRAVVRVDFEDVRSALKGGGLAILGVGYGEGVHRAVDAGSAAITSPLLDDISISGATRLLVSLAGPADLTVDEASEVVQMIADETAEDVPVHGGLVVDKALGERVRAVVIGLGLQEAARVRIPQPATISPLRRA